MTQEKAIQEAKIAEDILKDHCQIIGTGWIDAPKELVITAMIQFAKQYPKSASSGEKGDKKFSLEDLLEWLNKEIEVHSFKESQDKGKWIAERRDTIEATLLVVKHKIEANLAPKEHSEVEQNG